MTAAPHLPSPTSVADCPPRVDSRFYLAPVAGATWLAGIGLAALVDLGAGFWLAMAAAAAFGAAALWRVGRVGLALAGVAALALGGARAVAAAPQIDAGHVAHYNGAAEVILRGEVAAEPDVGDTNRRLRVAARELVIDGQTVPVAGLVLVDAPRYPAIGYGAELSVSGELLSPTTLNSANYAAYLARQGIHSVMQFPQVSVLTETGGSAFRRALLAVRERGRVAIQSSLPEPQASLLIGILLGDDSGLPRAVDDAFQTTGMTHIIAISGFNIALIIALLDRLAAPLVPRRVGAVVIAVVIVLYALLVGASASVVRAAVMGIAYLVGLRLMGRPTLALASLLSAAWLMTLWSPLTLWDVGFQLSLAATLGLLLYGEPWSRRLRQGATGLPPAVRRPATQLLGEGLVITLAAQVLTVPLLVYHFGALSLASLPANFLVLPVQPAVMLTGGLTLLAGLIWPAAGRLVGLPAWLFLTYTIGVIERLAQVPRASVDLRLPAGGLLAVYGAIAAVTLWAATGQPQRRAAAERLRSHPRRNAALVGLAVVVALAGAWWVQRPDGRLHVAFLDVGQGDATLIQSPDGRQVVYEFDPPVGDSLEVSLDARTGRPVSNFGRDGVVDLKSLLGVEVDAKTAAIGNSSPPLVFEDLVVIGPALEVGTRPPSYKNVPGRILAVDARTGALKWRFNTIPQKGEEGYETWEAGSAEYTGNAGAWAPLSLDEKRGYLYLPLEAATGDYYGGHRLGANLFSSTLACLDVRTGRRLWHFQTVHHDIWDWDNPTAPILADVTVDGQPREIVVQLTKQSFAYVLDRVTGKPIWPIDERPVPASDVPGERAAATQPFPSKPKAYDRQGVTENDLIDFTPELRAEALKLIADGKLRMGAFFAPPSLADAPDGTKGTLSLPGNLGGTNWEHGLYLPFWAPNDVAWPSTPDLVVFVTDGDPNPVSYTHLTLPTSDLV